jgi:L-aspartate oxidase
MTADVILPTRLTAPSPSWHRRVDVVVVGSGVAGLMVALTAAKVADVLVLTKGALDAGSTAWAQGGIAAAIDLSDHPEAHYEDTLAAGVGLCNASAVRVLVEEGPQRLAQLISLGTALDTDHTGALSLTREGGHGRRRIVHAGGDATGYEVQRALTAAVHADDGIEVIEQATVLDLLCSPVGADGRRRVAGVVASVRGADGMEVAGRIEARAVVLASGGLGRVYASSTNPPVATGDGLALALRAGASVADVEFVQFHPTVLWQGPDAEGQQLLVSEAVRGEGAVLVDATGARVMAGVHPQGDLAPRHVVAKAMSVRMARAPGGIDDHLWLDATVIGEANLMRRFPNIVARCRELGIDPAVELIPVAPGAHFACGGVRTDRRGRTDVSGLYAVGETACTGVHGANRLASNSLLEGMVFADRVGARLVLDLPPPADVYDIDAERPASCRAGTDHQRVARIMSRDVAVRRTGEGLDRAADALAAPPPVPDGPPTRADWEATNVHTVASVMVAAATMRTESRGCHWREDYSERDDRWRRRIIARLGDDGALALGTCGLEDTP